MGASILAVAKSIYYSDCADVVLVCQTPTLHEPSKIPNCRVVETWPHSHHFTRDQVINWIKFNTAVW